MRDVEIQRKSRLTVFVDADACPVKEEVLSVCKPYEVDINFVAAYTNTTDRYPDVTWKWVEPGRDAADLYILNHLKRHDIVITEDIGLAAGCLAKHAYVLTSRGKEITDNEIDSFLETRHLNAKARRSGKYEKGPRKIKDLDKNKFSEALQKILSKIEGFQGPI
ncbi:DUF188 domain-containing protein [Pradoshia sp. D12]|uniref:YaiI/YqxD family protein n=1 Tax=Bacillaceae TaxID=186817 RepID=UPI00080AF88C|nr:MULTISPECIES: DUF188 domain-containing protein [Bacillaceae]OCA86430.1 hypothetical protein A8L44_08480 [Bacillus sp. FJAT-27986]QFK72229.1 DUF188 domain-containing protein [Pradoshia sp. D12]TPF71278.1 DUF188 domain-containing protein [Bacillus sp. D12]